MCGSGACFGTTVMLPSLWCGGEGDGGAVIVVSFIIGLLKTTTKGVGMARMDAIVLPRS